MRKRLNIFQVAQRYGVAPSTVYAWLNRGWFVPRTRLGGRVFWYEDELDQWDEDGFPRPCENEKAKA